MDFPHTASFLTPEERAYIVHRKSTSIFWHGRCSYMMFLLTCSIERAEYDNSSVGEEEHFEMRHIKETLLDWQVYMHILIYMSIIAPRMYHIPPSHCVC